eukprot:7096521-Pyramimonas_sp.AAC.1
MRDEILSRAMQRPNYKRCWLTRDAPTGCNLPLLPRAGGDTRSPDAADALQKHQEELRCKLDS